MVAATARAYSSLNFWRSAGSGARRPSMKRRSTLVNTSSRSSWGWVRGGCVVCAVCVCVCVGMWGPSMKVRSR